MLTHVWPREGGQPRWRDEAAIAAIDDFLSEAHAAAPIFAGMVVEIMPEDSSAPPDIRKRWWGLVATNNKVVTRQGGGGAGAGDHGDRVMLIAPRRGARAIPVERSRVAKSTAFHVTALDAWAAADSKGVWLVLFFYPRFVSLYRRAYANNRAPRTGVCLPTVEFQTQPSRTWNTF